MSDDIIQAPDPLFAQVPGVPSSGGVAMNPPPPEFIGPITQHIEAALSGVPADGHGRLVAIATRSDGITTTNLAIAGKFRVPRTDRVEVKVSTWIGKRWGTPVAAGVEAGGLLGIDF